MYFDFFVLFFVQRVEFQTRERNSLFRDFVFSYFRCRQLHYYYYLKFQQKKVWKILVVVLVLTNTQYVMVKIIKYVVVIRCIAGEVGDFRAVIFIAQWRIFLNLVSLSNFVCPSHYFLFSFLFSHGNFKIEFTSS